MQGMMQSSSPREQEFQALHLLANVLADPAGYADKIKELDGIHRQIRAATADAQAAQEALKIETEKAHAAVAAAKNEADEHIARRHTQLAVASAAIEQREKDLAHREKLADTHETQLNTRDKQITAREQKAKQAAELLVS